MTDDPIPRDRFYNGRMKNEKAAVVLRLAPTWFRFGSFEILTRNEEFRLEKRRISPKIGADLGRFFILNYIFLFST